MLLKIVNLSCFQKHASFFCLNPFHVLPRRGVDPDHVALIDEERGVHLRSAFHRHRLRPALRRVAPNRRRRFDHFKFHLDRDIYLDHFFIENPRRHFRIRLQKLPLIANQVRRKLAPPLPLQPCRRGARR